MSPRERHQPGQPSAAKASSTAAGSIHAELAALRDLFIARDGSEMQRALAGLARAKDEPEPPTGPDELEFAFNRLFVGPAEVSAPPYASIYLEDEPRLMGQATLDIRRFYHLIGLVSPWQGSVPDDHISLELDALLRLNQGLAASPNPELQALRAWLLEDHMARWVPGFVQRLTRARETHPALVWAGTCLGGRLERELAGLGG
jgi:putative dimethyl sulfoxide reductase chaperone